MVVVQRIEKKWFVQILYVKVMEKPQYGWLGLVSVLNLTDKFSWWQKLIYLPIYDYGSSESIDPFKQTDWFNVQSVQPTETDSTKRIQLNGSIDSIDLMQCDQSIVLLHARILARSIQSSRSRSYNFIQNDQFNQTDRFMKIDF